MSCYNNNCYLPRPPRVWSRVQNECSLDTTTNNDSLVQVPYSNKVVSISEIGYYIAQLNKGNVLQYKSNSSNLTKAQIYSKIAKGKWINSNTTWATQSERGYTNPNINSLKRVGGFNIAINPATGQTTGVTTLPLTCPKFVKTIYNNLPFNAGGSPVIIPPPPPIQPIDTGTVIPIITPVTPPSPIVIKDEGSLLCGTQENICTGEIINHQSQQICNLTTDSDVPGPIEQLCWNDGTPTWYPRQRYVMTNSGNKWPYSSGYPQAPFANTNPLYPSTLGNGLGSAILPSSPIITSITTTNNVVTIKWAQEQVCLSVTRFIIFENDIPIQITNGNVFSFSIINNGSTTSTYYIISGNGNVNSLPSQVVSSNVDYTNDCYIASQLLKENTILVSNNPKPAVPKSKQENNINNNFEDSFHFACVIRNALVDSILFKLISNNVVIEDNITLPANYINNMTDLAQNETIMAINTYMYNFYNNSKSISIFTQTIFNELFIKLDQMKTNIKPNLVYIISIYENISKMLLISSRVDSDLLATKLLAKDYESDSKILRNKTELEKYISSLNNSINLFSEINVAAPLLELDPVYLIYIKRHGFPSNFIFNPVLLSNIEKEINT